MSSSTRATQDGHSTKTWVTGRPADPARGTQARARDGEVSGAVARRAIAASSIGNALEWFDIIVYASFAPVISRLFFPQGNSTDGNLLGLLITFGLFSLSYLIRPLGAMVLGSYADRHGRKKALSLTILTMFFGTMVMAFAPTAATAGPWAAMFILVSRLLQGFSAGGEFGSATAYLVEHSRHRKAFFGSFQVASQGLALLLASAFGLVLNTMLDVRELEAWGWRVPFFFGLLIGPVGFYIRSRMDETPEFEQALEQGSSETKAASPLGETLRHHAPRWLAAAGTVGMATLSVYLILFLPTFAVRSLHLPAAAGFYGGLVAGAVTMVCAPLVGVLADRVGPARLMTWTAVAGILLIVPMFRFLLADSSVFRLTVVEAVLGVIMALYFSPLPALMSSSFPTQLRATGLSIAYNLGVTVFGAFAPLMFTSFEKFVSSGMGPAYYYLLIGLISLVSLLIVRRRFGQR